jgi:predicted dehydrogenase
VHSPIRFGFWGAGSVARLVAFDLRLVRGAELRAVASRSESSARAFAAQVGATAAYAGLDALLDDRCVDVVYIATPHHCHVDDMLRCIDAGKAVLCEKPFTLNAVDAKRAIDFAVSRGVFLMEGMWTRFIPAVKETKRRIANGELGAIRHIQASFAYPAAYDPANRLFSRELGGGALLDRGVYLISLSQYFLGDPSTISGMATIGESGVDEQCSFQMQFRQGAIASCYAGLRSLGGNEAIIAGDAGRIRLHEPFYKAHRVSLVRLAGEPSMPGLKARLAAAARASPFATSLNRRLQAARDIVAALRTETHAFPGNGYQFELAEVVECLQEGRIESAIMPHADTLAVMRGMDSLRRQWGLRYPQDDF